MKIRWSGVENENTWVGTFKICNGFSKATCKFEARNLFNVNGPERLRCLEKRYTPKAWKWFFGNVFLILQLHTRVCSWLEDKGGKYLNGVERLTRDWLFSLLKYENEGWLFIGLKLKLKEGGSSYKWLWVWNSLSKDFIGVRNAGLKGS